MGMIVEFGGVIKEDFTPGISSRDKFVYRTEAWPWDLLPSVGDTVEIDDGYEVEIKEVYWQYNGRVLLNVGVMATGDVSDDPWFAKWKERE